MKKTICRALLCLLLAACLLPLTARTAHADKIYDEIVNYQVDVTPNTEDGSLAIQVTLDWKPLEDLPATNSQQGGAKIGIPNGSIREMTALTDNIQSIDHDNSLAYIDFTQSYDANETFHFAFRWVQEYMYTLSDSGAVSYDYTPGWFKEAPVDVMTLTWHDPASVAGVGSDGQTGGDHVLTASNMKPGDRLNFTVEYASWPSTLYWENSRDNLPDNSRGDDSYDDSDDSDDWVFSVFVIFVLVIFFVIRAAVYDGYAGGFGTRYVFVHGLWYPAAPLPRHIAVQLRLFAVGLGHELLQLVLEGRLRRGLHDHCGLCRTGRPPAAAGAGTTALGPGRSGRLRAFLLGLGLLDGQIDFPLRGDGEDLHGDLLPLGEVVVDVADKGSGHL